LSIDVDVPVNTRAEVHVPITDGQQALESGKPANTQPGVTYKGTTNGDAVYEVGSGSYRFLAATVDATSTDTPVAGTVPATLALTVNPVSFGAFTPGLAKDYTATLTGSVTSTAGDATLTVHDPSATAVGRLVNGSYALEQPLQIDGRPVAGASNPTTLKSWPGPVSNDPLALGLKQPVGAAEGLRTGSYAKTLTFTLSTTAP
jgi:hypothetical protein